MKCALPGMYGRKVPIESSVILDSYYKTDIDGEKILAEDICSSYDEVIEEHKKTNKSAINYSSAYFYYGRSSGKYRKSFEELKRELLQKDKEENE